MPPRSAASSVAGSVVLATALTVGAIVLALRPIPALLGTETGCHTEIGAPSTTALDASDTGDVITTSRSRGQAE